MSHRFILFALVGLTACGTTTTGTSPTLGPKSVVLGSSNLDGTVPSDGTAVVITNGNGQVPGVFFKSTKLTDGTYGGAMLVTTAGGNTFDVVAFSDDGKPNAGATAKIEATIIGTSDNIGLGTTFEQTAHYGRLVNTKMPVSGGGTWKGDYRATYGSATGTINGSLAGGIIAIGGKATLNATFGSNGKISGTITNRGTIDSTTDYGVSTPSKTFNDVTLAQTSITSAGSFSGTATDGTMIVPGHTLTKGSYEGLFAGNFGETIAGALQMTNTDGVNTYTELGIFTAAKQP